MVLLYLKIVKKVQSVVEEKDYLISLKVSKTEI